MDSAAFPALVAVASNYPYMALGATEGLGAFLRTVRGGMRGAAAAAAQLAVGRD